MSPEESMVSVRDGMFNVQLTKAGHGAPLVFLHGGGGFPGWAPFLDELARDYTVFAPRHPGWGESTGLDHLDDVLDMSLFYLDLFDALGLSSVNLLGSSLGGMFAAEVAALGGPYVKKLVLQAPAGLWLDDAMPPDIFTMMPDEIARATYHDPEAAQAKLPKIDPDDREAAGKAAFERAKSMSAMGKFIWPIWDKGLKKRIHRIKAPTLLVWGASDGLVPPVYGSEFQRLIPGSQLIVIPECGHVPSVEQPAEYVRVLREFLKG